MLDWSQYFFDLVVMLLCLYCWWRLPLLLVCVRVLAVNVFGVTLWALEVLLYWTNFRFNYKRLLPTEVIRHIHWLDFQNVTYPLILRSLFVLFLVPFFKCFKGKFLNLTVRILGLIAYYSLCLQCFLFLAGFWFLRGDQRIWVINEISFAAWQSDFVFGKLLLSQMVQLGLVFQMRCTWTRCHCFCFLFCLRVMQASFIDWRPSYGFPNKNLSDWCHLLSISNLFNCVQPSIDLSSKHIIKIILNELLMLMGREFSDLRLLTNSFHSRNIFEICPLKRVSSVRVKSKLCHTCLCARSIVLLCFFRQRWAEIYPWWVELCFHIDIGSFLFSQRCFTNTFESMLLK